MWPVEIRLLHGIEMETFQGPTHGRLWCGMAHLGANRSCPLCFPSHAIEHGKSQTLSSPKPKQEPVSRVSASWKLGSLEPTQTALALVAARPTWSQTPGREKGNEGAGHREREGAWNLFPWNYISLDLGCTGNFYKMTSQLSKLSWAFGWVHPLTRLTGLYDPTPRPALPNNPVPQ